MSKITQDVNSSKVSLCRDLLCRAPVIFNIIINKTQEIQIVQLAEARNKSMPPVHAYTYGPHKQVTTPTLPNRDVRTSEFSRDNDSCRMAK